MISADPKTTFPHVMACDLREPRSSQVRWFLRNLTDSDWQRYRHLADEAQSPGDRAEAEIIAELWADLRLIVANWRGVVDAGGQPLPPAQASLEEVLTLAEAWELYYAGLARLELTGDDRKNSGSPRPSGSAGPAAPATA